VYERLPQSSGYKKGWVDLTFDSSYAAGGYAIAYTNIKGLGTQIVGMTQIRSNSPDYQAYYDSTAGKIVVWDEDSEAASSASLGSISVRMYFIGQ
jgi:hypothetical protein